MDVDHEAVRTGVPLMIFPPVVRKKKRNPKRGCGVTQQQRRAFVLWNHRVFRRIFKDFTLKTRRRFFFNFHDERGLLLVTLQYIAELEVWLCSGSAHQEAEALPLVVSDMVTRSPALREIAVVMDELTNIFLDGVDRDFFCTTMMGSRATLSVISTLLTEPYLAGGQAAVLLLYELGCYMLPDPELSMPWREDLLVGVVHALTRTMMRKLLHQSNAALAVAGILSLLPAGDCPGLVIFCAMNVLQLLEVPSSLSAHGLGRAVALLVIVLVDAHDVDGMLAQGVGDGLDADAAMETQGVVDFAESVSTFRAAVGEFKPAPGAFGQAALQVPSSFVLSSGAFGQMLEIIGVTLRHGSSPQVTSSANTKECDCHMMLMELLWCLNVCAHSNRSMAESLLKAEASILTLKLAAEHFLYDDQRWLCSMALLQLMNNIIIWIPSAASEICQSFGSLLCNALQRNISRSVNRDVKRCALSLAAAFIKTPHQHAPQFSGCVMGDSVAMTGLASALGATR